MTSEAAAAASLSSSSSSSRGHLILRSHKPLPKFICAIPVPHPDASIHQLRLTVVAILTGQVSAKSSERDATRNGSSSTTKGVNTALSYSEHLKQLTIQEWRMKSLILELKQNALIAPETRESALADSSSSEEEVEERLSGFELQDDHECALLEHGDEINLWLKPGQERDSLRLPKLSSRHFYGLPNQPLLDRSGTILLGNTSSQEDFAFKSPSLAVREPAEPSSHSSSVSAHPDVQFETTTRHWAAPTQHRIVTVGSNNNGISRNIYDNIDVGMNSPNVPKKEKPRRLNSTDYFSSKLADQKVAERKQRDNFAHARSNSGPITRIATTRILTAEPSPLPQSPLAGPSTAAVITRQSKSPPLVSTPLSAPAGPSNDQIAAQLKPRQAALAKAERQEKEKARRSSMKKMPSDALVVGPGVQGKFGRMNSYDNQNNSTTEKSNPAAGDSAANGVDTLGNLDAFANFTAASADANDQIRPHLGRMRRSSARSGTSEEKKYEIESVRRPSDKRRSSSGLIKTERKLSSQQSQRPSIGKNTSSPVVELLPPMPMPKPINNSSSSPSGSWRDVLQAMNESLAPDALDLSLPQSTSPQAMQAELQKVGPASSTYATPVEASTPDDVGTTTGAISPAAPKSLTRAERRYLEVMKSLEAEREKQRLEEVQRREDAIKRQEEKRKAYAIKEEEARRKQELEKWQIWEEVKARQAKEKERGIDYTTRRA